MRPETDDHPPPTVGPVLAVTTDEGDTASAFTGILGRMSAGLEPCARLWKAYEESTTTEERRGVVEEMAEAINEASPDYMHFGILPGFPCFWGFFEDPQVNEDWPRPSLEARLGSLGFVIVLETMEETDEIEGNLIDSGSVAHDDHMNTAVRARLDRGDVWGWARVAVTVRHYGLGLVGVAHLGCCSFNSEDDFRSSGYFDTMLGDALTEALTVPLIPEPLRELIYTATRET